MKKHYKITPVVNYLGIEVPKQIAKTHGEKILFLGRWEKEKNVAVIFDLAHKLPRSRFIVAGFWTDQKDLKWFRSEIKKRGIEKQVDLIPKYNQNDLEKIFLKSSFWVHMNLEAFSLSALEAASHGLPIIIPNKSGVSELFEEGKHGFFPKSKQEFIKQVKFLHNNPKIARKMGIQAAKTAKNYTWGKHTQLLVLKINNLFKK